MDVYLIDNTRIVHCEQTTKAVTISFRVTFRQSRHTLSDVTGKTLKALLRLHRSSLARQLGRFVQSNLEHNMTVKFETKATIAPAGIQFKVWVTTSSNSTKGTLITWSDDSGLSSGQVWQNTETYTGDEYPFLASGLMTIPVSVVGATGKDITITADAGTFGTASWKIKFQDWGTNPQLGAVITNELSVAPLTDGILNNSITYEVKMMKTNGDPVGAGAEVQWFTDPLSTATTLWTDLNAKLTLVRGGSFGVVTTGTDGYAKVKVTASRSMAVTMQAVSPSQTVFGADSTAYFVSEQDGTTQTRGNPIIVDDIDAGFLNVTGKLFWGAHTTDMQNFGNSGWGAFLYVTGNGTDVPWATDDLSAYETGIFLTELGIPDLKIDPNNIHANQAMLFFQNRAGFCYKTQPAGFGVKGTYANQPDPNIVDRPLNSVAPDPDPGIGGYITQDDLRVHDGLWLQYANTLGPSYAAGTGKVQFHFYMNGVDKNGNDKSRMWAVDAVEAVDPATTFYHAVLDFNKANNYYPNPITQQYGLFWTEMVFIPTGQENNPQGWTYSQYNSYILATGA